ncbi:Bug family tripartite tricarboxylate transporter substrate binding protein [Actinoplanes couchii]|uniref:C4-dicarboxylate ABC transporter substrate-binding protein n=1 Tax=Actinoplanes couchii TaxID=403638 RepID=A0ABQ3XLN2_9ACTN|nr:tripartite tricarboxylate transporter substrate binding protein [Actinoplanes couchii]MDR6318299.1 putative tricarboxylic transport membrane protein [Actinoplanes couchii]GID59332.1 C4-dicarboxylate ABC transporter substrate-binding protein [Actinoplanes couchii]
MKTSTKAILAALMTVSLSACGATAGGGEENKGGPVADLRLMVPNTPGGGYDTTARTIAKVMEDNKIASGVEVFNLSGAGGVVGLQRTVNEKGNGKLAMQMGLGVVGASYTQKSPAKLTQTTPLAKVIEEPGAIVVPKESPYQTINDLVTAWKADPGKIAVGGGSSPGGPDHLLPMRLAKTVGIDPTKVNFVSYDGGGELLPAVLGGKIAFGASGVGEFLDQVEAGQVRVLAVTSAQRLDAAKDVPTLKESGIDMEFTNWRGIVAPPEISAADKQQWIDVLTAMHGTEAWKAEVVKHGWTDAFVTGDQFATFLTEQDKAVADVLTDLGLA